MKGFTLVELIMTIVVVAIVSIPLSLLLSEHVRSTFLSEDFTMARQLARFEMEKINSMDYASISSATFFNYEGYNYNVRRIVAYVGGGAASPEGLKKVTLEVEKTGSTRKLVNLVTYIAKNVSYGL